MAYGDRMNEVALHYAGFGVGLLVLTVLTLGLQRWARIDLGWLPVVAIVRAVVQLTVIALLLRGILAAPWTVAGFVVLMMLMVTVIYNDLTRLPWVEHLMFWR